jgi:hypothetical protein
VGSARLPWLWIGVLVAARAEPQGEVPLGLARALAEERLQRITVGPLSLPLSFGAVHHLLRDRVGLSLPRSTLARLVKASGRNPYFALEIARTLALEPTSATPSEPLPLPSTLRELAASRINALSVEAREAALTVAASPDPRIAMLRRVMASESKADAALVEAERAGVLTLDGARVCFTHPLLASAAYEAASADRHRGLHETDARRGHEMPGRSLASVGCPRLRRGGTSDDDHAPS